MKVHSRATKLAILFFLAGLSVSTAAPIHNRTATARINGSVAQDCTLATLPTFTFSIGVGYIHGNQPAILRSNSFTIKCSKGAQVQIGMDAGLYGSAAGTQFGSRSMKDPSGDYLGYELCHDSACSSIWSAGGYNYASPGDQGTALPVWARILTNQSHAQQGSYTDSVTVTVNF